MPTTRHTDAAAEPLTVAEARTHLREDLDDAGNNTYIGTLIKSARLACEHRLGRSLITTTWRLTLDAFPAACATSSASLASGARPAIRLHYPSVIAITSVQYVDADGATQTLDPQDYVLDNRSDIAAWLLPAPDVQWPTTADRPNAVTVIYTAGFGATAADVPAPIVHWIKLALTDLYQQRSRSSDKPQVPNEFADELLAPYKVWG
jgi:uncharacterized phiE125 gp8 family phage protein